MTETLQQKIDAIFHKQYFRPEKQELDKALQEFREQIKTFNTECDCPLCNERTRTIKNILTLIGEEK